MYLTMNRFKVKLGQEEVFEKLWKNRDSQLPEVPGFLAFHLMAGPKKDSFRIYASHTAWKTEADFKAWTKSEAFRRAHAGAGGHGELYDGPPELEVFETVQEII